jgi:2-dehydro-3-deoxygalactonokinase
MGGAMRWADGYIAADWGTTNRRAYLIDSSGRCVDEFEDGKGVLSVESDGFPAAVAEIRERLGDKPLLLAGMVGSNRGWKEVPYVPCPAGIDDLARSLVWVGEREAIIPGVSYQGEGRADVMRGEEAQLLGAVADGTVPPDCLVCHPGTHNKWATVADGRIQSFRTVMTGELFNLLREHSILSDLLQKDVEPGAAFGEGVRQGLRTDGVVADLFSERAGVLLGLRSRHESPSHLSGLLIGADVRVGLGAARGTQIIVMGRPELTELYAQAIEEAGRKAEELDGEQCFLAGIRHIAERISK